VDRPARQKLMDGLTTPTDDGLAQIDYSFTSQSCLDNTYFKIPDSSINSAWPSHLLTALELIGS
jgi:hypothetical protein